MLNLADNKITNYMGLKKMLEALSEPFKTINKGLWLNYTLSFMIIKKNILRFIKLYVEFTFVQIFFSDMKSIIT